MHDTRRTSLTPTLALALALTGCGDVTPEAPSPALAPQDTRAARLERRQRVEGAGGASVRYDLVSIDTAEARLEVRDAGPDAPGACAPSGLGLFQTLSKDTLASLNASQWGDDDDPRAPRRPTPSPGGWGWRSRDLECITDASFGGEAAGTLAPHQTIVALEPPGLITDQAGFVDADPEHALMSSVTLMWEGEFAHRGARWAPEDPAYQEHFDARLSRSMLGFDADLRTAYFVASRYSTLEDVYAIARAHGMRYAFLLDGGASSQLSFGGHVLDGWGFTRSSVMNAVVAVPREP
jgi:hypothetical protein